MGRFDEFARTLEKKIRQELENEILDGKMTSSAPPATFGTDELSLGFAWILGQSGLAQRQVSSPHKARAAYGVKARPARPHDLDQSQKAAYNLFMKHSRGLSPGFRKGELRRAWRQVAKATHPDQGGSSQAFLEAQDAYRCLQKVFN